MSSVTCIHQFLVPALCHAFTGKCLLRLGWWVEASALLKRYYQHECLTINMQISYNFFKLCGNGFVNWTSRTSVRKTTSLIDLRHYWVDWLKLCRYRSWLAAWNFPRMLLLSQRFIKCIFQFRISDVFGWI